MADFPDVILGGLKIIRKKNKENDVKLYWVVADINAKAESEWVDCSDIVPSLEYLYKDDDVMRLADKSYMMEGEWENQIGEDSGVVYVDLGLYDFFRYKSENIGISDEEGGSSYISGSVCNT